MKTTIVVFGLLTVATAAESAVDEGTVTAIDGKSGFQVATLRNGIIQLEASPVIMGKKPKYESKNWPDVYKSLRPGDLIEVDWGKDEKSGKPTAYRLAIKKRGG